MKISVFGLAFLMLVVSTGGAIAGENFSMGGSVGAISINNQMWYRVALQPTFKLFGKLKAAFNLSLTWNDTEGIKPWQAEDWANLILYIQWAEKGERPLYFRIGDLQTATLGHGFIVNRYSNMNRRAYENGWRNIGVEFDLDMDKYGVESIFNNILDISMVGVRPFGRPFKIFGADIPILNELAVGISYATDLQTGTYVDTTNVVMGPQVQILGADIDLPIIKKLLIYYIDWATLLTQTKGNGWTTGFMGGAAMDFFSLDYRFEYRNIGADFSPQFFDTYYEMGKPKFLSSSKERYNGWYGELNIGLFRAVCILVSYEDMFRDSMKLEGRPWLHAGLTLNENLFSITRQRISIGADYDHKNLDKGRIEDQIIQGRISYGVSENVDIVYVYTQRYIPGTPPVPIRSTSIETRLHF